MLIEQYAAMKIINRIVIVAAFMTSCNQNRMESNSFEITYKYDSIAIDHEQLPFYYGYEFISSDSGLVLVGFNHTDFSFDIFSLGEGTTKKIELQKEGPKGLAGVGRMTINKGHIIIPDPRRFFKSIDLRTEEVTKIYEYDLSSLGEYQFSKGLNMIQYEVAAVSPNRQFTAFRIHHPSNVGYQNDHIYKQEYYNTLVIDIVNDSQKLYHVDYPLTNDEPNITFGELDHLTFAFLNNTELVVGFQNSAEMRILDIETGEINYSGAALKELPTARPMSFAENEASRRRFDHYFKESQYHQINYHPTRELIYRCYKHQTESKTIFDYSQNRLLITDKDFNVLATERLDSSIYPKLFPYENGLVGLVMNSDNEDYIKICYLEFGNQ